MAQGTCSIDGCDYPAHARSFCQTHYARWRRTGSAHLASPQERFWSKVNKDGPIPPARPDLGSCWLWIGAINGRNGYGDFILDGRTTRAHRVAYTWMIGPIPETLQIDHLCRVRACVNPRHLEAVTQVENIRRGEAGQYPRMPSARCRRGHAMIPENTYVSPGGQRQCRTCNDLRRTLAWERGEIQRTRGAR